MKKKHSSGVLIQLNVKTTILFGILLLISMGLIFYLGISMGKSIRNTEPGQVIIRTLEKDGVKSNEARSSLFDPSEAEKTVESYEKTLKEILNEKTPPQPAAPKANKNQPPTQPDSNKPADTKDIVPTPVAETDTKNTANEIRYYTVQILATSKYEKANDLIKQLKQKKFEAYIQNIPLETGGTLYRVRVGRGSKASAEAVKVLLEKELKTLDELKVLEVD